MPKVYAVKCLGCGGKKGWRAHNYCKKCAGAMRELIPSAAEDTLCDDNTHVGLDAFEGRLWLIGASPEQVAGILGHICRVVGVEFGVWRRIGAYKFCISHGKYPTAPERNFAEDQIRNNPILVLRYSQKFEVAVRKVPTREFAK